MNLSQLRFANALASAGSFTAAAAECFVTQPTLSNGIAQLEGELGERLFVRTTRKVALTPFGVHLLPCIADVLRAQATLELQARAFLKPEKRLIRIGTSPLINAHLLGLMIEPFKRHNRDVDIVLREMNMADLYRMLDDGQLDFVFGVANVHKGPWTTTFLYREPLRFIPRGLGWPGQPGARSVALKDIAEETYVMVPDACGLARATRALFRSHRRKLHEYPGEAMSYQVLEQWAGLGIGAAIMPRSKLSARADGAMAILDKAGQEVMLSFEAAWTRGSDDTGPLQAFARHLRVVVPAIARGLDAGDVSTMHPEAA
jgi:LysR family transcriptional regulator, hydrogen peroxide-inducible genes activator